MMPVGLAGPASNLILASSAALVFTIAGPDSLFGLILVQLCIIDVVLALFNLIPAPPLTDHVSLSAFYRGKWRRMTQYPSTQII